MPPAPEAYGRHGPGARIFAAVALVGGPALPSYAQPSLDRVTMRQRAASLLRAGILAAAAMLLSGCTLSAALRHDEIRSVWGPGRALPPHAGAYRQRRQPSGARSLA